WAAWAGPYDTPILLVTARAQDAEEAGRFLVRVGLDNVRGYLAGGFEAWQAAGLPVSVTRQIAPAALRERLDRGEPVRVIDVRSDAEWNAGHIPTAEHIMGGYIANQVETLRRATGDIA